MNLLVQKIAIVTLMIGLLAGMVTVVLGSLVFLMAIIREKDGG